MSGPRFALAPMTPAERQARHRARLRQHGRTTPPAPRSQPRPTRWAAAVEALIELQEEYRAWLDNLPPDLEGSRLAEKLQAIAELDLEELADDRPAARLRPRLTREVLPKDPITMAILLHLTHATASSTKS